MKKLYYFVVLLSSILLSAQALKAQEINYKIHSMFIYHFTRYVDWPDFKKSGDFVIGVYGSSPIQSELETMASTKKAGSQSIVIKKINNTDEATNCHIVFIPSSKSGELDAVMGASSNKPVLIVTEKNGLGKKGSGINFIIADDKLKFEINKSSVESHGLKVSGDLIKLGILL
ncbi:MAG: YfiR family protein [Bacteroidota bacterium]|nr:YfiR family protein [Bacteroidota bacterium]